MIEKLVTFCESLDKRLLAMEQTTRETALAVSELRNVLAEPSGFITTRGVVQQGGDELKEALKRPVDVALAEARIEVQFAQAFYLSASPSLKDKLHEFLSHNELSTLLETIKLYQRAERLCSDAEGRADAAQARLDEARDGIADTIERKADGALAGVVSRMQRIVAQQEAARDRAKVANDTLSAALKRCEQFMAENGNIVKNATTPVKRIYAP